MKKVLVGIAVACALGAYAEERTVSTAQGLFEAIQAHSITAFVVPHSPPMTSKPPSVPSSEESIEIDA